MSTFPPVYQDVSLQVGPGVAAADVERALVDGAGDLLERTVLFDVYTGGNLVMPMTVLVEQYWREISTGGFIWVALV